MAIAKIYPTSHFIRSYKSLTYEIKKQAQEKEKVFKANPFDPRIKTHKLKGKLSGYYSYAIDYSHRILFRFINDEAVIYYDIGSHDIYER